MKRNEAYQLMMPFSLSAQIDGDGLSQNLMPSEIKEEIYPILDKVKGD